MLKPTLLLLRHVIRPAMPARLLILVTYRDTETAGRPELLSTLAQLSREPGVTWVRLVQLS